MPGNFTEVPDKVDGDTFSVPMWEDFIKGNLNLGVARLLADPIVLGAAAASIDLSSIEGDFAHLMIVYELASDQATGGTPLSLLMTLNAIISASAYNQQGTYETNSTDTPSGASGTSALVGYIPNHGSGVHAMGYGRILLPNYAQGVAGQPSGTKSFLYDGFTSYDTAGSAARRLFRGGGYAVNTVGPITDITLLPSGGNFVGGGGASFASRVLLYGLPN